MVMMRLTVLLGISLLVAASAIQTGDTVTTTYGDIRGTITSYGRNFRGVPYAQPPLGALRWQSPVAPSPWGTVKETQHDGPGCVQKCTGPVYMCPPVVSEDCLTLNIFTPDVTHLAAPLPVMVWIPGGNYLQGYGGGDLYDFSYFVQRANVIVVAVTYRVGSLGFLHTPWSEGNYGIQDQRLALRFVKDNVAAFGGDPNKITLWGQSAGAGSVGIHVTSPASRPLFSQAIMISNMLSIPLRSPNEAQLQADALAAAMGCTLGDANCQRGKSWEEVLAAQVAITANKTLAKAHPLSMFMPWGPVTGTTDLHEQPADQLKSGNFAPLPIIMGSVKDEVTLFIYEGVQQPLDFLGYQLFLGAILGFENVGKVNAEYPPPSGLPDYRDFVSDLGAHYIFNCNARNVTRRLSTKMPFWFYYFDHPMSFGTEGWGPEFSFCAGVTCHGGDLPFFFQSYPFAGFTGTAEEKSMSDSMIDYVTNFAKNGDPNVGSTVPLKWPQYKTSTDQNMRFQTPALTVESGLLQQHCNWWDGMGYHWG